jgi:hypothetical protein
MTTGEMLSFRPAYGVDRMVRLPGDWDHAVAQNPSYGLRRQTPECILQIGTR